MSSKLCPGCGASLPPDHKFTYCGAPSPKNTPAARRYNRCKVAASRARKAARQAPAGESSDVLASAIMELVAISQRTVALLEEQNKLLRQAPPLAPSGMGGLKTMAESNALDEELKIKAQSGGNSAQNIINSMFALNPQLKEETG